MTTPQTTTETQETKPQSLGPQTPEEKANANLAVALANPAAAPQKFKNSDGSVNGDALLQSYLHMEQMLSGKPAEQAPQQEAAAPVQTQEQTKTEPNSLAEALEGPAPTPVNELWATVETELNTTGAISEATLKGLKSQGVPDSLIQAAQLGRQAKSQADMKAAHDLVGGKEAFDSTMAWAKENLSPEERKAVVAGFQGPQSLLILQGLHARAQAANAPSGQVNTGNGATPTFPPNPVANLKPFGSFMEQQAAMADPKYRSDSDYRATVDRRIAVGAGVPVELAARIQ